MHSTIRGAIRGALMIFALGNNPTAAATGVDLTNPAFAPTGEATSIPIGHAEFCTTHRAECQPNIRVVDVEALSEGRWKQLLEVNDAVNAAIIPETDADLYQVAEYWTYPDGRGDCEDYVLEKRRQLIDDGWDASALLMTVVRQANGEGHAVLMVRTDRGDLVLDNQDGRVLLWSATPYQFIKRQSQTDAGKWVSITDARSVTTTASN